MLVVERLVQVQTINTLLENGLHLQLSPLKQADMHLDKDKIIVPHIQIHMVEAMVEQVVEDGMEVINHSLDLVEVLVVADIQMHYII